jgi:hypothetical protein
VKLLVFLVMAIASFLCACASVRAAAMERLGDVAVFGLLTVGLGVVALMQLRGDGKR